MLLSKPAGKSPCQSPRQAALPLTAPVLLPPPRFIAALQVGKPRHGAARGLVVAHRFLVPFSIQAHTWGTGPALPWSLLTGGTRGRQKQPRQLPRRRNFAAWSFPLAFCSLSAQAAHWVNAFSCAQVGNRGGNQADGEQRGSGGSVKSALSSLRAGTR